MRQRVAADPRQLFAQLPHGAVLDEAQRSPEMFSCPPGVVDERTRMGEFMLAGSPQFGLGAAITPSLAARVGLVHLLPLSWPEQLHAGRCGKTLAQTVWGGGYPALFDGRRRIAQPGQWFSAYTASYIECDLRQLLGVANLSLFRKRSANPSIGRVPKLRT